MSQSVYITTASVGRGTGGGNVAYNEILSLNAVTDLEGIYAYNYQPEEKSQLEMEGLSLNKIIPEAYTYSLDVPFLWDYFMLKIAGDFLPKSNLIHINGNPFGLVVQSLKKTMCPRIFVTVPAHNRKLSIEEFNKLGVDYPFIHIYDPYLWELYTRHIRLADVVICPSHYSADYLQDELDLTNQIKVIPHGCELPKIESTPQKFDVAYIGQAGPDKGLLHLIKAWSKLNLPEETLILAGSNPQIFRVYMGGNVRGNYHLTGYVEDVSTVYDKCSVYVQPSVTEGFGIEVLEAMSHGRPVIATEGCGSSELIEDGKEGFVVPIRNPDLLGEKIRYFLNNPSEVKKMGANARQKAEQYTWEKIRKQYEGVYRESL